jgi:hypothetical protein
MFDERRERRKLQEKIASLKKQEAELETDPFDDSPPHPDLAMVKYRLHSAQQYLDELETDWLVRKARRRGIEFPKDSRWWYETTDYLDNEVHYLTETGKAGMSRLIRDDKRASFEWWVSKVVVPLITALISVLSLIIALVSVSSK